jgi:predicted ArsR family transcriptional regulator
MDTNTMVSVAVALFDLARANRPANVERVAGRLGITEAQARLALRGLEARGLADAMRARLTLLGLAVASSAAQGREVRLPLAA